MFHDDLVGVVRIGSPRKLKRFGEFENSCQNRQPTYLSQEQCEEGNPEGPNIRFEGIVGFLEVFLRRQVVRCATPRLGELAAFVGIEGEDLSGLDDRFSETKVGQDDVARLGDEEILRLDVAVSIGETVEVVHGGELVNAHMSVACT